MKIAVAGLWHLGCVTAASCAKHFNVSALDTDATNVAALREGRPPIFEPGLEALTQDGLRSGRLKFTGSNP